MLFVIGMCSIVRERHGSVSAITYVLITGIDGAASEICARAGESYRRGVEDDASEVRLAGGLIKVV